MTASANQPSAVPRPGLPPRYDCDRHGECSPTTDRQAMFILRPHRQAAKTVGNPLMAGSRRVKVTIASNTLAGVQQRQRVTRDARPARWTYSQRSTRSVTSATPRHRRVEQQSANGETRGIRAMRADKPSDSIAGQGRGDAGPNPPRQRQQNGPRQVSWPSPRGILSSHALKAELLVHLHPPSESDRVATSPPE